MTRLSDPRSYDYAPYQNRPKITWPNGSSASEYVGYCISGQVWSVGVTVGNAYGVVSRNTMLGNCPN